MDPEPTVLVFYVNGTKVQEKNADPETSLASYIRNTLQLKGTKSACDEGVCGACTVMISQYDHTTETISHIAVNACLFPLCAIHGLAVTTVEGVGSIKSKLHPVQERLAESHGTQCGFCSPGMVMSMYALLRNNPHPTQLDIEKVLAANLCRCTGYRPILQGFKTFAKDFECPMGTACCKNNKEGETMEIQQLPTKEFLPYDSTQEPIFPSELQLSASYRNELLMFQGEQIRWYRPTSLQQLRHLCSQHSAAKLMAGNTANGLGAWYRGEGPATVISVGGLVELKGIERREDGVQLGASSTIAQLEHTLSDLVQQLPEYKTQGYKSILDILQGFAGQQIRNVVTLGGVVSTCSAASDLSVMFATLGASATISKTDGTTAEMILDDTYKGKLGVHDVVTKVFLPHSTQDEYISGYKQARKRENDTAIVAAAFRVKLDPSSSNIQQVAISYGGVGPRTLMAHNTMKQLVGRSWSEDLVDVACQTLTQDYPLPAGTTGGREVYRRTLIHSLFFKFFMNVTEQLNQKSCKSSNQSDINNRQPSTGTQVYEEIPADQSLADAVGRPLVHASAFKHTTGEAVFTDDIPSFKNELQLVLVLSRQAHAKIIGIDATAALAMPGVQLFLSHKDLPAPILTGSIQKDEYIFAVDKVTCMGQVIGAIVADTRSHAQRAAAAVSVTYQPLPAVITMQEAISEDSMLGKKQVEFGEASEPECVIEGEAYMAGQEHFYMETNATLVLPKGEDSELEIFCSTQNPTYVQTEVARALNVPQNRIVCRVKRVGGAFGGKESKQNLLTIPAAIAAQRLQRPVRGMLTRKEDMVATGGRHSCLVKYKIGCSREGKISSADLSVHINGGHSKDISIDLLSNIILHLDGAYKIPHMITDTSAVMTHTRSNTAMRAAGSLQASFIVESWMEHVANHLKLDPAKIKGLNMYREGEKTHFGQEMESADSLRRCWAQMLTKSNYYENCQLIHSFNKENQWKKRGIAVVPIKYGIGFPPAFLNQAGALVHIYTDGSVLLTHSGTENGQGLFTKMIQVASRALGVPMSKIYTSEMSTNTVPNASTTSASVSSDINGGAVINACKILLDRLQPYKEKNPNGEWEDWVRAAYFDQVSLSTTGFYKLPDLDIDMVKVQGKAWPYFANGAACTEVEIDCLTGDHKILRVDIVMDVGRSLNPAIDIGQIEGAFVQGCGLFTVEELLHSTDGQLLTDSARTYKIPGTSDIPLHFNVTLLKGASTANTHVYSSKGIGEPPLLLSVSAFFAIKNAVSAAREDHGFKGHFKFDSPATAENIRLACTDKFVQQCTKEEDRTHKPWAVHI